MTQDELDAITARTKAAQYLISKIQGLNDIKKKLNTSEGLTVKCNGYDILTLLSNQINWKEAASSVLNDLSGLTQKHIDKATKELELL